MSNAAAIGYAIIPCKKLGMTDKELQQLESTMHVVLDQYTEDEAEEAYRKN